MLLFAGSKADGDWSCVPSVNIDIWTSATRESPGANFSRTKLRVTTIVVPIRGDVLNASSKTRQTSTGEYMHSKCAAAKSGPTSFVRHTFGFLWGALPTTSLRWYSKIFISSPLGPSGTSSDLVYIYKQGHGRKYMTVYTGSPWWAVREIRDGKGIGESGCVLDISMKSKYVRN